MTDLHRRPQGLRHVAYVDEVANLLTIAKEVDGQTGADDC